MDQPIRVRILDHEYLIRSDEEEGHVREIVHFVNEKCMDIHKNSGGLSETKTAILAAFHIASDYFKLLKDRNELVKDLQERARDLNFQIDSVTR